MKLSFRLNTYWIISFLYMGLIFFGSSFPPPRGLPSIPFLDKVAHLVAFGILASLIYFAREKSGAHVRPIFIPFLIAFLYGVSDEIHQYFVPGRNADVLDALADAAGGFVFLLGIHAKKYWK
ncbi:MAG: VanZ family protein [Syntrophobacterales bacterium]|nr:MAG: VanZ family protein [Syntrophobacterales bacterium]